ncbi:hypothetical protein C8Q76DRAFT_209563 [Earliella scabrosa]|nr:hypothetical protein C8Q76DRAFT_209563 [Earliella scabrosa]
MRSYILTRAFTISALLVGAIPVACAAPVPESLGRSSTTTFYDRGCRPTGCLYAVPEAESYTDDGQPEPDPVVSATASDLSRTEGGDFRDL